MKLINRILFAITMLLLCSGMQASDNTLKPTPAQLTWQQAELTVIFHYDLHVFDGKVYNQGYNRVTPIPDYNIFNPTELDTDQWICAAKEMGAKIAMITATHETGFALYQSDVNPYCMKALKWKEGKGDIVRDFVNSCRKYGVQPGIYIGIRWNSLLGVYDFMMPKDGTKFQENRQAYYNKMCEGMTEELMSRYGDLAIVWYDGGGHGPELGGADVLPIVEKYQKNIIFYHNTQRADIRWGGSESGTVPYPCWGNYPFPYSHSANQEVIFKDDFRLLKHGDPNGRYYMPAMSDAPLRGYNGGHDWFYEPEHEKYIFPVENLMTMYYNSVGRNSTLILGLTPNDKGLLPQEDVARIKEFGDEIRSRFSTPIASAKGTSTINIPFRNATAVNHLVIQEDLTKGELVRKYVVEGKVSGKWIRLAEGSCIGHKRIEKFNTVQVNALRLRITETKGDSQLITAKAYFVD